MQKVSAGDTKTWVLPLSSPSCPGSGGTSPKLTQELHTQELGAPKPRPCSPEEPLWAGGSAAKAGPSTHGPC